MIAQRTRPTIAELRAEFVQRQAELDQKQVQRMQRALCRAARVGSGYADNLPALESRLADTVAHIATSAARCQYRTESRIAGFNQ